MTVLMLGIASTTRVLAEPPPLPDFVIESLFISPTNAVEGTPMTVTVTVKNQGAVAGDARYLDVWYGATNRTPVLGDVGDWWSSVGLLGAGESRTMTLPPQVVESSGTNRLFACIDFEDLISEASNTNNCYDFGYTAASVYSLLVPVHRFWSPVFSGHFFTMNEMEKNNIINGLSAYWTYEGIAFYTYPVPVPGTVPVYRFWSPVFSGHFFTINEVEKSNILRGLSAYWTYEGIAYYAYPTQVAATMPVYRFWSPVFSHHFFTINEVEKNNIIAGLSAYWTYEGIAYYAFTSATRDALAKASVPEPSEDLTAKNLTLSEEPILVSESADVVSGAERDGSGATGIQSATTADVGDVMFPLWYPGREVTAYVYDSLVNQRTCVLPATNSPDSATFTGILADRSYRLEVFAGDPVSGEMIRVHGSWFESSREAPATITETLEAASVVSHDGVGSPILRIKTPVVEGSLTLKLYSSSQGVIQTLSEVPSGETVELPLAEWNRWFWVGGWRDADDELVLSLWLRHETGE